MPININPAAKQHLVGHVRTALEAIRVRPGRFAAGSMDALLLMRERTNKVIEGQRDAREQLLEAVGHSPVFDMVGADVLEPISEMEPADGEDRSLAEIPGFEDFAATATGIVDKLLDLPHQYVVSLPLPKRIAEFFKASKLDPIVVDNFAVLGSWHPAGTELPQVPPEKVAEPRGPMRTLAALMKVPSEPEMIEIDRLCMQLRVSGYIYESDHGSTETDVRCQSAYKAFLGLGIALGAFVHRIRYSPLTSDDAYLVHRQVGGQWRALPGKRLRERERNYIADLVCEAPPECVCEIVRRLAPLFSDLHRARRLKLAGKWLFESFSNDDPVMRFMQQAIAVEVLLESSPGDSGVTQTLANRCAYLIAKSADEREAIKREFPRLYQLRSTIVHNGRDRLSPDEHSQSRRLRDLSSRIVDAELRLALADLER